MECPIDLAAAAANDGGGGGDRGARLPKLRRGLLVEAISVGLTVCVKFNVVRVPMPASLKSQLWSSRVKNRHKSFETHSLIVCTTVCRMARMIGTAGESSAWPLGARKRWYGVRVTI